MRNPLLKIILFIGLLAVGGTYVVVKHATDRFLEEQARTESLSWAGFMESDLQDLDHILRGAPPTIRDIQTLGTAKNIGNVVHFKIYDHDRTTVWATTYSEIGDANDQPYFIDKVIKGEDHVILDKMDEKVFARAFVPIMSDEKLFRGAIEVTLDLSHLSQQSNQTVKILTGGIASLFIILLVVTGLLVRKEIERERRLTRQARQAAKARNDFIAMVSHELRTPVNGILGALGLIEETKEEKERNGLIQTASGAAEHLRDVINDILDFTQLSAQRTVLVPTCVDLHQVMCELDAMFRPAAIEKKLAFHVIKDYPDAACGMADLKRLRQILFNLVGNAIKFTESGHVKTTASLSMLDDEPHLEFRVEDTGVGLMKKDQEKIFKRFQQVGDTMTRQFGGIGLGLSVCQELATLMKGTLKVESEIGKGSTFILNIPFPVIETCNLKTPLPSTSSQDIALNILLAEDNPTNQKVLRAILEHSGHTITIAADGEEAIKVANDTLFDLILMDIQMPNVTGDAATRVIRSESLQNKATPIIALSANVMPEQVEGYLEAGMQACLSKPIKPQDLRQAVLELYAEHSN